jgi:YHS domain-containing protein
MMIRRAVGSVTVVMFIALWLVAGIAPAESADPSHVSLKGYDPVAYFTAGAPTEGKQAFEMEFDGSRYRFASQENMSLFIRDPDKYAPQFAGSCANGVSRGLKFEANPLFWRIVDGKLYVFAGSKVPDQMDADPAPLIAQARANWKNLQDQPYK